MSNGARQGGIGTNNTTATAGTNNSDKKNTTNINNKNSTTTATTTTTNYNATSESREDESREERTEEHDSGTCTTDTFTFQRKRKKKTRKQPLNHGEMKMLEYHDQHSSFIEATTKDLIERGKSYFDATTSMYASYSVLECGLLDDLDFCNNASETFTENDNFKLSEGINKLRSIANRRIENSSKSTHLLQYSDETFLIPAKSSFIVSDFEDFVGEIAYSLGETFDVIVMDPPWENKSVKRKKCYNYLPEYDLKKIPMAKLLNHNGVLAVWVTNKQKYMNFVTDVLFPYWDLEVVAHWHWVKLSSNGNYVTDMNSTQRKPYEPLLIGRKTATEQRAIDIQLPFQKIVCSIPSNLHSRKPPLNEIFDHHLPHHTSKFMEMFARSLIPGWLSWGNEPIKFQNVRYFVEDTTQQIQVGDETQ